MKPIYLLIFFFVLLNFSCKKDDTDDINYGGKYYGVINYYYKVPLNEGSSLGIDTIWVNSNVLTYRYKRYILSSDGKVNSNTTFYNSSDSSTLFEESFMATISNNQIDFTRKTKRYLRNSPSYSELYIDSGVLSK
jgi:hypothetical protein